MAYGKHVKLQGELQAPLRFKWLTPILSPRIAKISRTLKDVEL